ncbi:MAG: hypothetical protein ACUVRA_01420 [Candidatus Bathyarchaeaceae archaeon]
MATDSRKPWKRKEKMNHRFCWNCYNFEDRRDIDGVVLCTKGHTPGTTCEDFAEREEVMGLRLNGHFCWSCCNFEDRRNVDGVILCARGHHPEGNCDEFVDKNGKFREIADNNRHERVLVKALVMENKNPVNHSISMQNLLLKWKNSHKES